MKQNKYDDPRFFSAYSKMARSVCGLEAAGEWPAFKTLLPDFKNKRVLDIGCGFGWHCRYASEQNATFVYGVDISEKMIEQAIQASNADNIQYHRSAIEDMAFKDQEFDIVLSSLALHYIKDFELICNNVYNWLKEEGSFIFSVEHPVFSAAVTQDWCYDADDNKVHWPVDNYLTEGIRNTAWLTDNVIKYHRTVATYINTLIKSGFKIARICEPGPSAELLIKNPTFKDEFRRPMFLLVSVNK